MAKARGGFYMVRISNPIEQLIHNLEQERAKEYWERVHRFKVHEEQQRNAGEAHEKKQLEYMRSAGIKLNEVEKGLEEDARKLKSYLEQTRPPLISRPKQAPLFSPNLGGQFIPPYAIFLPPSDPGVVSPSDPSQIKIKDVTSGRGSGWGEAQAGPTPFVDVVFSFTPHQSARFSFTACFAFHGFFVLQADDGFFTSKNAHVTLNFSLDAFQFVDRGWKSFPSVIDSEGDNINEFDSFDQILNFSDAQDFREGDPVVVTARITINAIASGSGSHAEINFADGDANFIQPQGLWVSPVP
jgi:hypothetical protein